MHLVVPVMVRSLWMHWVINPCWFGMLSILKTRIGDRRFKQGNLCFKAKSQFINTPPAPKSMRAWVLTFGLLTIVTGIQID